MDSVLRTLSTDPNKSQRARHCHSFGKSVVDHPVRRQSLSSCRIDSGRYGIAGTVGHESDIEYRCHAAGRRALAANERDQAWVADLLLESLLPVVCKAPWIFDLDSTVVTVYGKQGGSAVGYKPTEKDRPFYSYHTFLNKDTCPPTGR